MARGTRKITLGGSTNTPVSAEDNTTPTDVASTLATETESTPMTDATMTDTTITTTIADPNMPVTAPPTNGDNGVNGVPEIDEDLAQQNVNMRSSLADKRNYYMREARKLGRDYAGGVLSQITLAEKVLEGAVSDALTYAQYPNGSVQDDALEIYRAFRMPKKDSPPVDTNSTDFNSNVAKYRNMIYLGMNHRNDAQQWFGSVVDMYNQKSILPDIKRSMKNFRGTFEAAVDVVREQLDRDTKANGSAPLLDDDEIFDAMLKKDKVFTDDAVTQLIDAYKALNLAKEGKATKSGKGNFAGIKHQRLDALIEELQDFCAHELDAQGASKFSVSTHKQKRTRRTIKAPVASGNGAPADPNAALDASLPQTDIEEYIDESEEAQELGNQE